MSNWSNRCVLPPMPRFRHPRGRRRTMKIWTNCRVCDGSLEDVLSLGDIYVSDFLDPNQPDGPVSPLDLVLCTQCQLLQLRHTVSAETMYKTYWYRSGTNQTMRNALAEIAHTAEQLVHLNEGDAVLDIGCNDGTLLSSYSTPRLCKIGFDPAGNLADYSRRVATEVVVDFFSAERFLQHSNLQEVRPKLITSIAMFYDLEQPQEFVSDVKRVLHPDGLWIIQMSYLPTMLRQNDFGNICHEHLAYYSLHSLEYLLALRDFEVVDVELNDVNGGSYRVYVRNRGANPKGFGTGSRRQEASARVEALRKSEAEMGLSTMRPYIEFATRVRRLKEEVSGFVRDEARSNKLVYVYGASTKGNTMLQYFGLDGSIIRA